MKGWRSGILVFELFLLVLILVLPQVDLPDFALHKGASPIVARSRVSGPPVLVTATIPNQYQPTQFGHREEERSRFASHAGSRSFLSLLCILLC